MHVYKDHLNVRGSCWIGSKANSNGVSHLHFRFWNGTVAVSIGLQRRTHTWYLFWSPCTRSPIFASPSASNPTLCGRSGPTTSSWRPRRRGNERRFSGGAGCSTARTSSSHKHNPRSPVCLHRSCPPRVIVVFKSLSCSLNLHRYPLK